jgi:hypothetical protein
MLLRDIHLQNETGFKAKTPEPSVALSSSESALIREAVTKIRLREQSLRKKHPVNDVSIIYWQTDELRHLLYKASLVMLLPNGEHVQWVGSKHCSRIGNFLMFDVDAMVAFQFVSREGFDNLLKTYTVFNENGMVRIHDFDAPGFKDIAIYCSRMDDCILGEAESLRSAGFTRDIFEKMWAEMGGDLIKATDFLGRRLGFLRDLVKRFKANKELWREEMIRLRLIKG